MKEQICLYCKGTNFVEATDYINLRPLNSKSKIGSEKIYTVCLNCGEVFSIKIKNPSNLLK